MDSVEVTESEMTEREDDAYNHGKLAGELGALKERMNRHEDFVGSQLRALTVSVAELTKHINQSVGANKVYVACVVLAGSLLSGLAVKYFH